MIKPNFKHFFFQSFMFIPELQSVQELFGWTLFVPGSLARHLFHSYFILCLSFQLIFRLQKRFALKVYVHHTCFPGKIRGRTSLKKFASNNHKFYIIRILALLSVKSRFRLIICNILIYFMHRQFVTRTHVKY